MKKLKPLFIILTAVLILFSAVCFPDLLPGTYTVTETPSDRYVAQEPKTVKVEYGKTASVSFENKLKKGNLEIIKTSEDGVVADIEFTVTGKNYNKTAKTDKDKELILDMPEGTYFVRKKTEAAEPEIEPKEGELIEVVSYVEPTKVIVKDGKAVLANAIYGHEYEFKEIEAPKSYQLSDALYSYEAVFPFQKVQQHHLEELLVPELQQLHLPFVRH